MKKHTQELIEFTSKADTLLALHGRLKKSYIEDIFVFKVGQWSENKLAILHKIADMFKGEEIIIRSSALVEDGLRGSKAGAFKSVLNVDSQDPESIKAAIEIVEQSYKEKDAENPNNLIAVQTQAKEILFSGTLLTRDWNDGPYYVVNYSYKDTTVVTSGKSGELVKILRSRRVKIPQKFSALISAVREIEVIVSRRMPLDKEFGVRVDGRIIVFQVRPLLLAARSQYADSSVFKRVNDLKKLFRENTKEHPELTGQTTYFCDMPDWNPSEIIGSAPRPLASSLFNEIYIRKALWEARASQGYTRVNSSPLMLFGNKPYVDIRSDFNSFLPHELSPRLKTKLMDFYLDKLRLNPQLQDRVEFNIVYTCYDLSFEKRSTELLDYGFTKSEVAELREALLKLTNSLLRSNTLTADIIQNETLEACRRVLSEVSAKGSPARNIEKAVLLVKEIQKKAARQYVRLARLAFLSKSLLNSFVEEQLISSESYEDFLRSISTINSSVIRSLHNADQTDEESGRNYGQLRPGTYDITTPRYNKSKKYTNTVGSAPVLDTAPFDLTDQEHANVSRALQRAGLDIESHRLFDFIRQAISAREESKFLASSSLSDVLEYIATAGELLGFSRDDLSFLDFSAIEKTRGKDEDTTRTAWAKKISANRKRFQMNTYLSLPPVIFSETDFEVVRCYEAMPNYISNDRVSGDIVILKNQRSVDVAGKIVVLEAADPGYDWVFSQKPKALITKYGGPAAHVAIICGELGVPAAIGVGDSLFESISRASFVTIDCENQKIHINASSPEASSEVTTVR